MVVIYLKSKFTPVSMVHLSSSVTALNMISWKNKHIFHSLAIVLNWLGILGHGLLTLNDTEMV